jgi:transcriptional regulator with XRE-family HTH domain
MDSKRLKAALEERGITIGELAEMLGVSRARVASWCRGVRRPCCRYMVARIEKILGGRRNSDKSRR